MVGTVQSSYLQSGQYAVATASMRGSWEDWEGAAGPAAAAALPLWRPTIERTPPTMLPTVDITSVVRSSDPTFYQRGKKRNE